MENKLEQLLNRMLRKRKDNSDYEIDRELTGKFAIEKNAEYQDRIAELEEENKKLSEENGQLKEELDKAHTAYRAVRKVNKEIMNGYV